MVRDYASCVFTDQRMRSLPSFEGNGFAAWSVTKALDLVFDVQEALAQNRRIRLTGKRRSEES
jgi:ubiquinone/menaquinone biosynthesis C-methylase UbiE